MDMLRKWTQCDFQKVWSPGNLKEGKNEVVPEEPGKVGCIQRWVEEVSEWANGTVEGNGIWTSEGVARHFKTSQYIKWTVWSKNMTLCAHFCFSNLVANFGDFKMATERNIDAIFRVFLVNNFCSVGHMRKNVTKLRTSRFGVWIPVGKSFFPLLHNIQTGSGPTRPHIQWVPALLPLVNLAGTPCWQPASI
jgi:hypothetical protein